MKAAQASSSVSSVAEMVSGPRSLIRTLRILDYVAKHPEKATLAKLSQDLEAPKSSLLGLLRALCDHGYLNAVSGAYQLGSASFALANAILPGFTISLIAKPIMRRLMEQTGETVLIAIFDREAFEIVYVDSVESQNPIRYTVPIGTRRPLYCTSSGRIFLAYSDEGYIDSYLRNRRFDKLTSRTMTSAKELRASLDTIRKQGFAYSVGEFSLEVVGAAAPIFEQGRKLNAVLILAAPASRAVGKIEQFAKLVAEGARTISSGN